MKICKNCSKKFKPRKGFLKKQEDCDEACLIDRFDKLAYKSRNIARIYAQTLGYRSIGEVRFKALCNIHKLKLSYEIKTVSYQHKPQKYTADFTFVRPKREIHLEYKGKLDTITRKKLLSVKRCNPDMELRLVFEKPNNFLYKGAKTRYWQWAEKNNFKWYDWRDVKNIKRDLK